MQYTVNVQIDNDIAGEVEPRLIRAAARAALAHQAVAGPASLTVAVTGDETLRDLNRRYLGHDRPTDVLSFPAETQDPETETCYLGDIAIAFPRALAQAAAGGHPVQAEIQLLVVHGVLHLLGHDHARSADRKRMWAAQAEILTGLKAPITGPTAG